MSLNNVVMGEGYIPAYQISASPFVTQSLISIGNIQQITFPQVTRFFNVQNVAASTTNEIAVSFTAAGFATGNFFSVPQGSSFRDELRVDRLFVSCSSGSNVRYQVIAGLTGIPSNQFLIVTGSNGFLSVG